MFPATIPQARYKNPFTGRLLRFKGGMKTGLFVVAFLGIYPQGLTVYNVGDINRRRSGTRERPRKAETSRRQESPKSRLIDRGAVIQKYSLYTSFCAFCGFSEKCLSAPSAPSAILLICKKLFSKKYLTYTFYTFIIIFVNKRTRPHGQEGRIL